MDAAAAGNADLLRRGARPLTKSRATGRANLDRVREAMAGEAAERLEPEGMLI